MSSHWPDELLTTVVTPQLVAEGSEIDAYHLGVSAYLWGYPLVRMERVCREYTTVEAPRPATSYRGSLNQIGFATELATPQSKDMPTANGDTLYLSAVVDLVVPYLLTVPDTADRYYVINVFSMYQELEHYIGRRTTGTAPGRFVIVPPGWQGELPADATALRVTTPKVWLWGRMRVDSAEGPAPAVELLRGIALEPAALVDGPGELPALPDIERDDLGFFTHLGAAMTANPIYPADTALVAQFERIGLTRRGFDAAHLTPGQRDALRRALRDGPAAAQSAFSTTAEDRNGWTWVVGMDDFGFNYPRRAVIAGPYLGGNGEREAMYPGGFADRGGEPLTGQRTYRLCFTSEPPVDAFWSLTMYRAADKMLVANPLDRYKIGSDSSHLHRNDDGSFDIVIQHDEPADQANWLPAPPDAFYLILRLYQPTESALNGTWTLPAIERTD